MIFRKINTKNWIIVLLIFAALFLYVFNTVNEFHYQLLIIYAAFFLLAFSLSYILKTDRKVFQYGKLLKINITDITDVILSLVASLVIFKLYPKILFDDAGFILRYLDNFREGYFYSYNIQDGPVFGISGFIHGIFCGLISFLKILQPKSAVLLSNFTGLFLLSFIILKILRNRFTNQYNVYLVWLAAIFGVRIFLDVVTSGMETPLHLAIIFISIYFFLANKPKAMWFFMAMAVISKLDAVPIVIVIGMLYMVTHFQRFKELKLRSVYVEIILFAIFPLAVWVLFCFWIFGSPLPQSAFAKVFYYGHPADHWFPFAGYFMENKYMLPLLCLFGLFMIFHLWEIIIKKNKSVLTSSVFGFSFLAFMLLYYLFNPVEKMLWYYSVPSFLIILQLLISFIYVVENYFVKYQIIVSVLFFALFYVFTLKDVRDSKNWNYTGLDTVERERIRIGEYLGELSKEDESLLSAHGHISRHFKGYVLDISGLNSRITTKYELDHDKIVKEFHPDYIVNHAWSDLIKIYSDNDYRLTNAFYDISKYNFPNWIVFRPNNDRNVNYDLKLLTKKEITGVGYLMNNNNTIEAEGKKIKLDFQSYKKAAMVGKEISRVIIGVKRIRTPFKVAVRAYLENIIVAKEVYLIEDFLSCQDISRKVETVEFKLPYDSGYLNFDRIELAAVNSSIKIMIYSPLYEVVEKKN